MAAAVLVGVMISFAASVVVRIGRIWRQTRHVQLCMDELSNQMEQLISLDEEQRNREDRRTCAIG